MKISSIITPLLAMVAVIVIEYLSGLHLSWFTPSLTLALLIFGVNALWGNGTASNLVAATVIAGYALWSEHFSLSRAGQIIVVFYVIAGANGYLKNRVRAEHEARVRNRLHVERLKKERQVIKDIFAKSSREVQRMLILQDQASENIRKYLEDTGAQDNRLLSAIEDIRNSMTLELGYESIDQAVARVKAEMNG